MIYCTNDTCKWCFEYYTGETICNAQVVSIQGTSDNMQPECVVCMSYEERHGKIKELQPGRLKDGSYKGQLKR
jgi:hypothetical protein